MAEIRNSALAGLAFGFLFGLCSAVLNGIHYAILTGGISSIAFGTILYFFVTSKKVKRQTEIETADGQHIIYSGGANHFLNGEAVGGKLYLLTDKLQFQSHNFNIQNHSQTIYIEQVKEVRFYNTLRLVPNGLAIITVDGETEKFVVNNRRFWKEEIEKIKALDYK